MKIVFEPSRSRLRHDRPPASGPVVYLMGRDQRHRDNWALLQAQQVALQVGQPLLVVAPLGLEFPEITARQATFMVEGLVPLERDLDRLNIRFTATSDRSVGSLARLLDSFSAGAVVTDFSPLRPSREWKKSLSERVAIHTIEVDAHNIVPCWAASDKQEYAAYTLRPKINRLLGRFLAEIPEVVRHPHSPERALPKPDWALLRGELITDLAYPPVASFVPGETAAAGALRDFLRTRLSGYSDGRNDPNTPAQSGLSPYLHFGQLSAQRVALEAQTFDDQIPSQEAFLEELIIRRELSDNFCFYNDRYDSFESFAPWAQVTLNEHRSDPRPYLYSREDLEAAHTHDPLWNAAQTEMVTTGKMHGYMRMYWAKKILEWSVSPEEALATAICLNDRFSLDGCDPNGYAGIAWSIGGVHDRAWFEREIFGKIRYMSDGGCRRKFDVARYIARFTPAGTGAAK